VLNEDERNIYKAILRGNYESRISMNNQTRRKLLDALLKFFGAHVSNFEKLNSLPVLQEVMRNN
jgi:hypothetical protein